MPAAPGVRLAAAAVGQRGPRPVAVRRRGHRAGVSLGHNPWRFASAEDLSAFLETNYGPTAQGPRAARRAEGPWDECRAEIVALAERLNEARDGSLLINAEYLVASGRKTV